MERIMTLVLIAVVVTGSILGLAVVHALRIILH